MANLINDSTIPVEDTINADYIISLSEIDGKSAAPIDLTMEAIKQIKLPKLVWQNMNSQPTKMKLTNSGHTVVLSGKWNCPRPHLSGGPLLNNYVFSQLHFHWGIDENEGSDHTIDGISYPMEMHVVFFKSTYLTQEAALKENDGVIILVYFFKVVSTTNSTLESIVNSLKLITEPKTSVKIEAMPLSYILHEFENDYLLYWGCIRAHNYSHPVLWIICRQAFGVSNKELEFFRELKDNRNFKIVRNFQDPQPLESRSVFHANPSTDNSQILLPELQVPRQHSIVVNYNYNNILDWQSDVNTKELDIETSSLINQIIYVDKLISNELTDLEKELKNNILNLLKLLKNNDNNLLKKTEHFKSTLDKDSTQATKS
uniref:Alpha-carbonic anhydrase domain-containing protein n=3 Tax=Clastoptera arizonana TaxID=38151 RepID=A0A1B6CEM1_9HEMI